METFFTADTHFGHANIIKYSNRPFKTVEEHDEILIKNWNDRVKPGDQVFHLGDFAFRNKDAAEAIRRRLVGNIFLIEGNHDSAARQIKHTFGWYFKVNEVRVEGQDIFLSHYAHRVWNRSHHGCWHLYGHSHNSLPDDPNSRSFDIGVDAVAAMLSNVKTGSAPAAGSTKPADYRPLTFAEVKAVMDRKTFKPIDHHGDPNRPH